MPEQHGVRFNDKLCANCASIVASLQTSITARSIRHTFDWEEIMAAKDNCAMCYVNCRECSSRLARRRENTPPGGSLNLRIELCRPGLYSLHYAFRSGTIGTLSMVFAVANLGPEGHHHGALWNPSSAITFTSRALPLLTLLRDCIDHHSDCALDKAAIPTRLLEIGEEPDGALSVRLVETARFNGRLVRYATLSHCWGFDRDTPITTTSDTYSTYTEAIPWDELSQTFRDALTICHAINLHYLWIDSLCILQGDSDDWSREAALMADVFGASEITIAGVNPRSPEMGLYLDSMAVPLIAKSEDSSAISMVRWPAAQSNELTSSYLFQRGWVFQELLLSRRQIFFTPEQFYWQCRTCIVSEDGTEKSQRNLWPSPWMDGGLMWRQIAEAYSIKDFTYVQDRLAALAGAVELYSLRTHHSPLLGMWKESLAEDLGWVVADPKPHQPPRISLIKGIPSWTWLFWDQRILFWPKPTPACVDEFDLECIESSVTWASKPMTSDIVGSKLKVQGLLRTFKLDHVLFGDLAFLTIPGIDIKECYIRIDELAMYMIPVGDASRFIHAECLFLKCYSDNPVAITFLLLEEIFHTGETRKFRRIGVGRLEQKPTTEVDIPWVFKGAPRVIIELV